MKDSFINFLPGVGLSILIACIGIFSNEYIGTEIMGFDKSPISSIMLAIIIGLMIGNIMNLPCLLYTSPSPRDS